VPSSSTASRLERGDGVAHGREDVVRADGLDGAVEPHEPPHRSGGARDQQAHVASPSVRFRAASASLPVESTSETAEKSRMTAAGGGSAAPRLESTSSVNTSELAKTSGASKR